MEIMSKREPFDCYHLVKQMGPQHSPAEAQEMYSWDRPAYMFWNGFGQYLREQGLSDQKIVDIMRHSTIRHALDNWDEHIVNLGRVFAAHLRRGVL